MIESVPLTLHLCPDRRRHPATTTAVLAGVVQLVLAEVGVAEG